MPKRIRDYEDIYIAPDIIGKFRNGTYFAEDERNNSHILNPTNINDKILIYERQVQGWFLDRATRYAANGKYNGFVVLMLCMSYLEGVEQYKQGQSSNGRSSAFFISSINRMYPGQYQNNQLQNLYRQSRCGLFHNGMVGSDIIINNTLHFPMEFVGDDIKINQKLLLIDIKNNFKQYITQLKNTQNTELRESFNQMFSVVPA